MIETYENKLIEVIKTLFHLQTQIKFIVENIQSINENTHVFDENFTDVKISNISLDKSVHTLLSNYSIIIFCSFIEEYNNYFTPSYCDNIYKDRVIKVRRLNKLGVNRINKWKDISDFRNRFVAHNFRDSKGNSFFSNNFKKREYIIPNTISEKQLFFLITNDICLNIRNEFYNEIKGRIMFDEKMIDNFNIISEEVNVAFEIKNIMERQ